MPVANDSSELRHDSYQRINWRETGLEGHGGLVKRSQPANFAFSLQAYAQCYRRVYLRTENPGPTTYGNPMRQLCNIICIMRRVYNDRLLLAFLSWPQ